VGVVREVLNESIMEVAEQDYVIHVSDAATTGSLEDLMPVDLTVAMGVHEHRG
jgi:hypothetical protein